ncbi:MAG: tetratricopeptide repeat protein [Magnetococcales bacterium]|nr:tetratricopeptide repeat protein [Magnetococcales bacterium]
MGTNSPFQQHVVGDLPISAVNDAFSQVVEHFNGGRYLEAEQTCNSIIQIVPDHVDAINALGVIAQRVGRHDLAIAKFEQALKIGGANRSTLLHNLGISLSQLGKLEESINVLQEALGEDQGNTFISNDLQSIQKKLNADAVAELPDVSKAMQRGMACHQSGQIDKAIEWYNKILEYQPDNSLVLSNLGAALESKGDFGAAISLFKKAIALHPDCADYHFNLSNVLAALGNVKDAVNSLETALSIKPEFEDALNNLGAILMKQDKFDAAITCFKKAIEINPGVAYAQNNLGAIMVELGRESESIEYFEKAIKLDPEFLPALNNLGAVLIDQNKPDAAQTYFVKVLSRDPNFADAHYNIAKILDAEDKLVEAAEKYQRALSIDPNHINANWNLALVFLKMGELDKGLKIYDWRLKAKDSKTLPIKPGKMWSGEPLYGKNIVVYAEQGIGDEILFSGFIPYLHALSPGRIFLECAPRLEPIFKRSFSNVHVYGKKRDKDLSWVGDDIVVDYSVPIGSLPIHFISSPDDFVDRDSFLLPNPKLVEKWNRRLVSLGDVLKVGISWRGGKEEDPKKNKSTPLTDLVPLLCKNAKFINLQYGDTKDEVAQVCSDLDIEIHDWEDNDPLKDMDNHAALISVLDLVISVDNATIHMSGALGVPTWDMVITNQNWPWMNIFEESTPFYKSVRLFRRSAETGNWDAVIGRVATALQELIDKRGDVSG